MGQVKVRYGNHMPIPENIGIVMPDDYSEERFLERARTDLKWSFWPRRCHSGGRWMWLTPAYRARYVIKGPGDDAVWTRWYSREEMIVLKLKGY
jgi:hypothetical protein